MWNRFLGPKSAFFKGSLNTHTLINAALSFLAQKHSCWALSIQNTTAAKTIPFSCRSDRVYPASMPLRSSPSAAAKHHCQTLLSPCSAALPTWPLARAAAHAASNPSHGPAQPHNCPAHIPLPSHWEAPQDRGTSCFVKAWHLVQYWLRHNCLLQWREWPIPHKGEAENTIWKVKNPQHFYLLMLWLPLFAIALNTTLKTLSHMCVRDKLKRQNELLKISSLQFSECGSYLLTDS